MPRAGSIEFGCVFVLALFAPAASGQVFKCTDADGKVTYTDVPCLRSESSATVDTRANVADHSSIRKEATRLPGHEPPPPAPQAPAASPAPPDPPARPQQRSSGGYSR